MRRFTIEERFERQQGVVAVWQLVADGHSAASIRVGVRRYTEVHDGVYLSGHAPATDAQRWRAATLTAPHTALAGWSAAAQFGLTRREQGATTVVRPGRGRRLLIGASSRHPLDPVLVTRSSRIDPDLVWVDGTASLSAGRTVLDLLSRVGAERGDRLVRDALRLKQVTTPQLRMLIGRHHGRRGVARLRALVDEYAPLPLSDTDSDAEALALAILQAAGIEPPLVTSYPASKQADLFWPLYKLLIELDGPQYHQFKTYDARKDAAWRAQGITVHRLSTDDVYERPHLLLAAAPAPKRHLLLP